MHPDIANDLAAHRHTELVAEAAHHRLVREAKRAQDRHPGRRSTRRWWLALVPNRALAAD
jgi:hypothetical protein